MKQRHSPLEHLFRLAWEFRQAAKNDPVVNAWCKATLAAGVITIGAAAINPLYAIGPAVCTGFNAYSAGIKFLIRKHYDGEPPDFESAEEWKEDIGPGNSVDRHREFREQTIKTGREKNPSEFIA